MNGTTAGRYNSAAYGPLGKGIVHYFYNTNGELEKKRTTWEQQQGDFDSDAAYHGLYSGPGSIRKDGLTNSENYDFSFQPIDWADAISKRHDQDYETATKNGEPYAGYLEDIRTVQADRDMVKRVTKLINGATNPFIKKNYISGVDTFFFKK